MRRNFEERGSRIEDPDKAARARHEVARKGPPGRPRKPAAKVGDRRAPAEAGRVRPQDETLGAGVKRRRRRSRAAPRAADRKRFAHERPPLEVLPERPDLPRHPERDWRPADGPTGHTPTEHTPTVAGFSLSAALLTIPIQAARFFLNLGAHAAHAIVRRLRNRLNLPIPH